MKDVQSRDPDWRVVQLAYDIDRTQLVSHLLKHLCAMATAFPQFSTRIGSLPFPPHRLPLSSAFGMRQVGDLMSLRINGTRSIRRRPCGPHTYVTGTGAYAITPAAAVDLYKASSVNAGESASWHLVGFVSRKECRGPGSWEEGGRHATIRPHSPLSSASLAKRFSFSSSHGRPGEGAVRPASCGGWHRRLPPLPQEPRAHVHLPRLSCATTGEQWRHRPAP